MAHILSSIDNKYWDLFKFQDSDLEFIYTHLLELEAPQTPQELCKALIKHRIEEEEKIFEKKQKHGGHLFMPKDSYEIGETLIFTAFDWQKGKVIAKRSGINPDLPPFEVVDVQFQNGVIKSFASKLETHILNQPLDTKISDPFHNPDEVFNKFGENITRELVKNLENKPDIVRIAGSWFPRSLLVDVNIGHLNLAEALLEMEGGGPLTTQSVLNQIELPPHANPKLTEFALNLALQEDNRFDEVGPTGEVLWYLKRLEPVAVQQIPMCLRIQKYEYDRIKVSDSLKLLDEEVTDELDPDEQPKTRKDVATISIIYPHLRSGTLPLSGKLNHLFPTALESQRIRFTFIDGDNGAKFSGWVVRPEKYIFGLSDWYSSQNLIPGSLINIRRGSNPGEVIIKTEKKRATKSWIRTAIIGVDGGIVLSMQNKPISVTINDRMAVFILDLKALDNLWDQNLKIRTPIDQVILSIMRELSKLNPQGHVHIQELYATLNIIRRFPPGALLSILFTKSYYKHMVDLYFRIEEGVIEGMKHE